MGSKTLLQTHLGRADTTAGFSLLLLLPRAAHRWAGSLSSALGCCQRGVFAHQCLSTRAGQCCRATAMGSEGSHPFLSRAFHQGRWLSSRMKYSSPFCSCRSCAFMGS